MKAITSLLAMLAVTAIAYSPLALHAQDQAPPPPDQGGAPPPPMDQGAPPPPDQQGAPPPDQGGDDSGASFDDFYNNLSSQGQWVQTQDYGYVFQPTVSDPNWAPYTDGHWVYTDYGWTWVTDEPWGWATYHYGRWVNIDGEGWVWVPGYQWAPAWVSWRYGGGYCGWAPLPPATFVGVEFGGSGVNLDFGFHFGSDCDTAYGIGPGCYNFIQVGYIGDPYYRGHYIDRNRNYVIINNTRNITNINISRGGTGAFGAVRVGGPSLAQVNAVSHTRVQQVRITTNGQVGRNTLSGGTLSVYAPRINPATARQGKPATVARSLSTVQINRGTSITHPLQVNSQFKPAAPSESAINAARAAAVHAPKSVATSNRVAPTVAAAKVQQEHTQAVQKAQAQAQATHYAAPSSTHTAAEPAEHATSNTYSGANTEPQHNAQVEHTQAQSSQESPQHEEAVRQQQQSQQQQSQQEAQQREQAVHQQQQSQQETQQREEAQRQAQAQSQAQERAASEEHAASQEHAQPQEHSFAQPQEHASPPPQEHAAAPAQHSSPSGGGGSPQHASGGGGGGGDKNKNNNGQGH